MRRHLITGAPWEAVLVAVLASCVLVVTCALTPTAELVDPGAGDVTTLVHLLVRAGTRTVMFAAAGAVLLWRARSVHPEADVWRWLGRAAWVAAGSSLLGGGLDVLSSAGPGVSHGAASFVLSLGVLLACPLFYQGLVRWNRYRTVTSELGDWLNGLGSVLTLTAVGTLLLPAAGSPLALWPAWQSQLWLLRTSAELMLLGTAATVLVIGGLSRDVRAWALTGGVAVVVAIDVGSVGDEVAAAGNGPASEVGWALLSVTMVVCAVLRAATPSPRPVTSAAPTTGSFVVLIASVAVLVTVGCLGDHVDVATARWAALWGGLGALSVSLRGVHLITLLADLVVRRHEALTDDLTDLPNRRALHQVLEAHFARRRPVTLMILDLDRFKQVNDRFGHAVGDELLRRTAALLRTATGPDAFTARLGGDEFAVVLPDASPARALAVSATLGRAVGHPVDIAGRRMLVAGSIGIGIADSVHAVDVEELLRNADAAMYRAKAAGGGAQVHDQAASAAAVQQARLVEELKTLLSTADAMTGLDAGQVEMHYQAQVDRGGRVVGVEALARWRHPRLGLLSPDRFLPLVEDYGLMPGLTTQALRQAVQQAAAWRGLGHDLRVSVNLSATCLTHPDLDTLLGELLAATRLPPSRLTLEVTETSVMLDPEASTSRLETLAARGIGISIDDYGSGYSSLAYLSDLPADELKIDRSLVNKVTTRPRTADIVAGTVLLAHRLGLRVVAEGVEDDRTLHALRDLGVDETQGYLHNRPMPPAELLTWLHTDPSSTAGARTDHPHPVPRSRARPAARVP